MDDQKKNHPDQKRFLKRNDFKQSYTHKVSTDYVANINNTI